MTEIKLLDRIDAVIKALKNDKGSYVFRDVIRGRVPNPEAIKVFPSVAFYIAESKYEDKKTYQIVTSEVLFYTYNRHDTTGLSVDDIDSTLITNIRNAINKDLVDHEAMGTDDDRNILSALVTQSVKDGGSLYPRSIVEISAEIVYVDPVLCETGT